MEKKPKTYSMELSEKERDAVMQMRHKDEMTDSYTNNPSDLRMINKAVTYFMDHYNGRYFITEVPDKFDGDQFAAYFLSIEREELLDAILKHREFAFTKNLTQYQLINTDPNGSIAYTELMDMTGNPSSIDLCVFYNPYIVPKYYKDLDVPEERIATESYLLVKEIDNKTFTAIVEECNEFNIHCIQKEKIERKIEGKLNIQSNLALK